MALTALGLAMLIFLGYDTSLSFIIISQVIMGMGFGFFSSPNTNAAMSSVEKKVYGVASGILGTMRLIGQTISQAIATVIFALLIGHVQITPEYYPALLRGVSIAMAIAAALSFGGIFASLVRAQFSTRRNPRRIDSPA